MSLLDWLVHSTHILGFVCVQTLIAVTNALLLKRVDRFPPAPGRPKVSVLVPARDEEQAIGACVRSLLAQDYADLEVIVLDDGSQDRTAAILAELNSDRLRVLQGQPLPADWNGKAWACEQLADAAKGDLLFFTDADTVFQPQAVRSAVNAMSAMRADLLTAVTANRVPTLGEQLTVPFVPWSILSLLPMAVSRLFPRGVAFTAANGKFLLFRREAYEAVGRFHAVRDHATEDIALAKLARRKGFRTCLLDATSLASARMYCGLRDAVAGFSKNLFALFNYRVLVALFVWCWLLTITWHPIAGVAAAVAAGHPVPLVPAATIVIEAGIWLLASLEFGLPWHLFLLGPAIVTVSAFTGIRAMVLALTGRARWKGRRLATRRPRLI
ncbi:MAG TPA: glycosyltransferase [bacterium]|nr:glycosyltransferase [bacterium]